MLLTHSASELAPNCQLTHFNAVTESPGCPNTMLLPLYLLLTTTITLLISWTSDFVLLGLQHLSQRNAGISFSLKDIQLSITSYNEVFPKEEYIEDQVQCYLTTNRRYLTADSSCSRLSSHLNTLCCLSLTYRMHSLLKRSVLSTR
jgi:hypothetical protein